MTRVGADQRGHGLRVSMEVHSRSDLEQLLEAVTKLESEVIQQCQRAFRKEVGHVVAALRIRCELAHWSKRE